jgi:RimJ/RimL family protein N-acetyltransferase
VIDLVAIERTGTLPAGLEVSSIARDALGANVAHYNRSGFEPPWIGYLAIDSGACVGCCAFKSGPRGNRVEIAYHTFAPHEGRGIATEMARMLVAIARASLPGVVVAAQTLPEENASTRILTKLGFARTGWADDDEAGRVWEWTLASDR